MKFLEKSFRPKRIKWMLAGSFSLILRGMKIEAHDIDIITTKSGGHAIDDILRRFRKSKFAMTNDGIGSRYHGVYELNGIKVDVIAGIAFKAGKSLMFGFKELFSRSETVTDSGIEMRLVPLEYQFIAYLLRPKDGSGPKKIRMIMNHFKKHGYGRSYLKDKISNIGLWVKVKLK